MKNSSFVLVTAMFFFANSVFADDHSDRHKKYSDNCKRVLIAVGGHSGLETALKNATHAANGPSNGGLDLHMWGTVVSTDGTVCAVVKTGGGINEQWLGSRVISAQKANTAVLFSLQPGSGNAGLDGLALSTANLWAATQPGGSLFGLQFSNPVDTRTAYRGESKKFGSKNDPMRGSRSGGVNVFGGGLALYDSGENMIGGLGVSGDTSCADHNVAWRTRDALGLDNVPKGLSGPNADNIIYDIDSVTGKSTGGFGHPTCGGTEDTVNAQILIDHPIGN